MSCAPLICLIVWTVLFEGVEIKDGMAEAIIKFINFDNLTQHLANVFMMWIDFYLNDLSVITSHFLIMYVLKFYLFVFGTRYLVVLYYCSRFVQKYL